jgi:hypothetical protein
MFNLYEQFVNLFPRDTVKVGVAVTNYSDGTCLLNLSGGGSVKVFRNGTTVTAGLSYFYKSAGIVAQAPSLINVELTV